MQKNEVIGFLLLITLDHQHQQQYQHVQGNGIIGFLEDDTTLPHPVTTSIQGGDRCNFIEKHPK